MRELVLVHGRSQEKKDAGDLKQEWLDALFEGLGKSGLHLPIPLSQVHFPYYGQTLYDLVEGVPPEKVAEIVVRGTDTDPVARERQDFVLDVLDEVMRVRDIGDDQVAAEAEAIAQAENGNEAAVRARGPMNWAWVRAIARVLDRRVPGASGATVALVTYDVHVYLGSIGIRDQIETGVRQALASAAQRETVVVAHSLGSVVAYNLLRREGKQNGWKVPLFVTVGSPLGVTKIKRALSPNSHPVCVDHWFNAMDPDDIVSLYPLDARRFRVDPQVENKTDVDNRTSNQHGISGYLSDPEIARRIHDALTA